MSHAARVRQVEALMQQLDVTMHDLQLFGFVDGQYQEHATDFVEPGDGDLVFQGTVEEAFDKLHAEKFSLHDDARWAEVSYDHERDLVHDALVARQIIVDPCLCDAILPCPVHDEITSPEES